MKTVLADDIPIPLRKPGLTEKIQRLCEENDVIYMVMFGSYVRGEQKHGSDIDIGIEYSKNAHKSLFDLLDLQEKLTHIFRHKVDLGVFGTLRKDIVDEVKKEMIVLYEK
jgi:predicted nucleotidyltransferase